MKLLAATSLEREREREREALIPSSYIETQLMLQLSVVFHLEQRFEGNPRLDILPGAKYV
jgi:hypothetical protein